MIPRAFTYLSFDFLFGTVCFGLIKLFESIYKLLYFNNTALITLWDLCLSKSIYGMVINSYYLFCFIFDTYFSSSLRLLMSITFRFLRLDSRE